MAAAELRFLCIFAHQLVADAVEQLHVALVGVFLESVDEGVRHCPCCFASDCGIRTKGEGVSIEFHELEKDRGCECNCSIFSFPSESASRNCLTGWSLVDDER
jgi:hypothetical protein